MAGYGRHASSELAAAIAYRVLFSLVPLAALLVSLVDLVLPEDARRSVKDWLLGVIPGPAEIDRSVERAISGASVSASLAGLVALVVFLWTASGMMAAIRISFRVIWESDTGRPYVRGKLLDFALVLCTGLVAALAFGLTIIVQIVSELGRDLTDVLGSGSGGRILASLVQVGGSLVITFLVFGFLYRSVPPQRPSLRAVWPGALVGAVGFHAATAAYSFYLARFSDFNSVYGPLGAMLGFLLVVYIGAAVLLFGAELVAASARIAP